jgi:outer membrane protein
MYLCTRNFAFVVAILVCFECRALSQQPDKVLSLQDCIHLAESAPSPVRVAELERTIADRDVTQARANFLPQTEVLSNFIYNSPRLDDPSTFSFIPLNAIREYAVLGTVRQEFDTSGRLRAEMQRARANQEIGRVNTEIARRDLRRSVAIAYYRLLLTRQLINTVNDTLKESESFAERAQTLFEGGEAARADVVKAASQVAFLKQALNAAEMEAKLANRDLAAFWTVNVDAPVQIVDVLEATIAAPQDVEDGRLFMRRLEFSLFDAQKRGYQADAKHERSAMLPQLSFVFQYGVDSDALRWRERGYAAFVNLRIPVFDWFHARSRVEQFKLRAEEVDTNRAMAERTFSRDYQNSLSRSKYLFTQIALTREQVRLAEEDLKLSRLRYEGAEGPALDVVTAQNQLAQARNNYYTTVANYLTARLDLEVASGK